LFYNEEKTPNWTLSYNRCSLYSVDIFYILYSVDNTGSLDRRYKQPSQSLYKLPARRDVGSEEHLYMNMQVGIMLLPLYHVCC